jgi:hypothetical protein
MESTFEGTLKKAGWELNSRNESGDPGKGTYVVSLSFKRASRTALLSLEQAKDGTTQYTVTVSEASEIPRRLPLPEK